MTGSLHTTLRKIREKNDFLYLNQFDILKDIRYDTPIKSDSPEHTKSMFKLFTILDLLFLLEWKINEIILTPNYFEDTPRDLLLNWEWGGLQNMLKRVEN